MALEPSSIQRDRMLAFEKTKLTLVQFLVKKDPASIKDYLDLSHQAVIKEGGQRQHQLQIDQTITGQQLPYQHLTVDYFPSSEALLLAHESTREIRTAALEEIYAFYLKTNTRIQKILKRAGLLSPTLTRWLGTGEIKELPAQPGLLDPQTDPGLEQIKDFSSRDPNQSFYMMNLNRFTAPTRNRSTGKAAYQRYSARIIPYLVSVGGYPDSYARILGTYIGDQRSGLENRWDDFALVYYPSRASFLRLMTNTPKGAAAARKAGLKRAVLMACITDQQD